MLYEQPEALSEHLQLRRLGYPVEDLQGQLQVFVHDDGQQDLAHELHGVLVQVGEFYHLRMEGEMKSLISIMGLSTF